MIKKNEVDTITDLLTKDVNPIAEKTIFDIIFNKLRGVSKPWYTKLRKESIWEHSRILKLVDESLGFRIIFSLLLAYISILVVTFSEKAFKGENICFSIECIPRLLWSLIKIENIEGFSIAAAATLYLIESRDRKRIEEYQAWQVLDIAQSGGRKKSDARLKALESLNSMSVSLRDQQFDNIDLQGIDLHKGNLQGATFCNSILEHSNFSEALLVNVNFVNTKLIAVNFERANLNISNLDGSDLTIAKLTKASLAGASAKGANFRYAKMEKSDLRRANFQNANLSGANLENASMAFADLRGAYILGTNLKNVELSYAKLSGAIYSDNATFSEIFEVLKELKFNYFGLDDCNRYTIFPDGFDPQKAGMIKIEVIFPSIVEIYRNTIKK
jgi:BTB/POZ domain-containing protein KCTD9